MKKLYIKPEIGKGCFLSESAFLVHSALNRGEDISSGTVEADSRQGGSFWDDSE